MAYDSIMQNIDDIRDKITLEEERQATYESGGYGNGDGDKPGTKNHFATKIKKRIGFRNNEDDPFNEPEPKPIQTSTPSSVFGPSGANPQFYQAIAREHANLLKFIGLLPKEIIDASIFEKQTYVISITINGATVDFDLAQYNRLSQDERQKLSDAMIEAGDITDAQAEAIFDS